VKDSATHHMYLKSNVDDNFDIIERLSEVADKKNVKVQADNWFMTIIASCLIHTFVSLMGSHALHLLSRRK
jgi:hypothetical protein